MMKSVRFDVVRQQVRSGNFRMALCVIFLPNGYELSASTCRTCGGFEIRHHPECPRG